VTSSGTSTSLWEQGWRLTVPLENHATLTFSRQYGLLREGATSVTV
jgi:hypothetical protein